MLPYSLHYFSTDQDWESQKSSLPAMFGMRNGLLLVPRPWEQPSYQPLNTGFDCYKEILQFEEKFSEVALNLHDTSQLDTQTAREPAKIQTLPPDLSDWEEDSC